MPGGLAVEVLVREATPQAHRTIATSLEAQDVPVRELHLVEDRRQLQSPMPLRGDLREQTFSLPRLDHPAINQMSVRKRVPEATLTGGK